MPLQFELIKKDANSEARRGRIKTTHGIIETPVFMSVGTFGSVRTLDHIELNNIGVQIILGNTYHLYLRPGPNVLKEVEGYHKLICWDKPILTDSGGFQIFSLPHQRSISEKGVTFKSYIDQSLCFTHTRIKYRFSGDNRFRYYDGSRCLCTINKFI